MEIDRMLMMTIERDAKEEHVQRAGISAAMILCNSALSYHDPDVGVEIVYRFDFQLGLKGARRWQERGSHQSFSVVLPEDEYSSRTSGSIALFLDAPVADSVGNCDTTYTVRIGIYKQRYRKNGPDNTHHTEHVRIWSDYLVLTTKPKSCGFRYSWASEPAIFFRDAATLISGGRMDAIVPVPAKARGVLGSKATLRFEITNSI
jgi:hypothetical protein